MLETKVHLKVHNITEKAPFDLCVGIILCYCKIFGNLRITFVSSSTSSTDIPDYFTTWSALVTTLLTLLLPEPLVLPAALGLASAFGVDERSVQFLEREYIPEIQRALGKKSLNLVKKSKLFSYTLRMIKKMVFAFKFQERTFPIALLTSPLVNQVKYKRFYLLFKFGSM